MADTDQVLNLAAIIREVDGSNNKGAAALAESILDHPRFRAALAEEPAAGEPAAIAEQLSDEELLKLAQQYSVVYLLSDGSACHPFQEGYDMRNDVLNFARAVLARWGNPAPQPPADGEVAELALMLRGEATNDEINDHLLFMTAAQARRAADLLQRLSPPQPVPVSERWPEFSDCDDTDRVWCWNWAIGAWRLNRINRSIHSHWLPAHALPIPSVEKSK